MGRLADGRGQAVPASPVVGGTPLPVGTRLGNFEVTGIVHRDSSGIVYAGEDRSVLGKVAIKEFLPAVLADRMASGRVGVRSLRYQQSFRDGKQRFLSDARMLAALDEPALIRVLRCWKQHGTAYMAMPLYEGQTLTEVLRDSPKPSEAWLKAVLGPLLDALATLHKFDCYPCNVTPDNIVVLQDGTPLLFAFGAGRRAKATAASTPDFDTAFAPIEQYADDPAMVEGPWTDIYSVAAVLHFAITGKQLPAPAERAVSGASPLLRNAHGDYSASFLDAVDRGLAVLPGHRPQTIAQFRAALGIHRISSGASAMARLESPASPSAAREARRPLLDPAPTPCIDLPEAEGTLASFPRAEWPLTLPPSPETEPTSPAASSPATMDGVGAAAPWKLILELIVVGLLALGLLAWAVGGHWAAPETLDRASSTRQVPTVAQPKPPAATSPAPTESVVSPVAANPVVAEAVPHERELADAAAVTAIPGTQTTSATAPPPQRIGKIRFSIQPWGEIIVDGKPRGASPPIKELSLPEGRHRIEIRNGTFPGYEDELDVRAGSTGSITYSFKAP